MYYDTSLEVSPKDLIRNLNNMKIHEIHIELIQRIRSSDETP